MSEDTASVTNIKEIVKRVAKPVGLVVKPILNPVSFSFNAAQTAAKIWDVESPFCTSKQKAVIARFSEQFDQMVDRDLLLIGKTEGDTGNTAIQAREYLMLSDRVYSDARKQAGGDKKVLRRMYDVEDKKFKLSVKKFHRWFYNTRFRTALSEKNNKKLISIQRKNIYIAGMYQDGDRGVLIFELSRNRQDYRFFLFHSFSDSPNQFVLTGYDIGSVSQLKNSLSDLPTPLCENGKAIDGERPTPPSVGGKHVLLAELTGN